TTTTSWASPRSRILSASSRAISSNGLMLILSPSVSTPLPSARTRTRTLASTTRFSPTSILSTRCSPSGTRKARILTDRYPWHKESRRPANDARPRHGTRAGRAPRGSGLAHRGLPVRAPRPRQGPRGLPGGPHPRRGERPPRRGPRGAGHAGRRAPSAARSGRVRGDARPLGDHGPYHGGGLRPGRRGDRRAPVVAPRLGGP